MEIDNLAPLFHMLLPHVPSYLVWFAAMVLAVVFWSRHPGVSFLTLLASIIFLLQSILLTFLHFWLIHWQGDHETRGFYLSLLGLAGVFLRTGGWVLILWAVFGWRKQYPILIPISQAQFEAHAKPSSRPGKNYPPGAFREKDQ